MPSTAFDEFSVPSRVASRWTRAVRLSPAVCLAVALTWTSTDACAAIASGLTTSVGLLVAVSALLLAKGGPGVTYAAVLTVLTVTTAIAAIAIWKRASAVRNGQVRRSKPNSGREVGHACRTPLLPALPLSVKLPMGFERAPLLEELRVRFMQLQAAWDLGERQALAPLTTPEMLDELSLEMPSAASGSESGKTEVVSLKAVLLGFEVLAGAYLASVEFSGLIRESPDSNVVPFQELWMLAKSKEVGSDWKLARHQALL